MNSCAPARQPTTVAPGLRLLWKIQILRRLSADDF
jgi:hypothetical protein